MGFIISCMVLSLKVALGWFFLFLSAVVLSIMVYLGQYLISSYRGMGKDDS